MLTIICIIAGIVLSVTVILIKSKKVKCEEDLQKFRTFVNIWTDIHIVIILIFGSIYLYLLFGG